jgi:hypothetical protein
VADTITCKEGDVPVADKLSFIGWLFAAVLVSGLAMRVAGKALNAVLAIAHKLLALLCLILLFRAAGTLWAFHAPPLLLPSAIAAFAVAFLASFATGVAESIPSCAGALWLNLHRAAAAIAAIACVVAGRLIATASRT